MISSSELSAKNNHNLTKHPVMRSLPCGPFLHTALVKVSIRMGATTVSPFLINTRENPTSCSLTEDEVMYTWIT